MKVKNTSGKDLRIKVEDKPPMPPRWVNVKNGEEHDLDIDRKYAKEIGLTVMEVELPEPVISKADIVKSEKKPKAKPKEEPKVDEPETPKTEPESLKVVDKVYHDYLIGLDGVGPEIADVMEMKWPNMEALKKASYQAILKVPGINVKKASEIMKRIKG